MQAFDHWFKSALGNESHSAQTDIKLVNVNCARTVSVGGNKGPSMWLLAVLHQFPEYVCKLVASCTVAVMLLTNHSGEKAGQHDSFWLKKIWTLKKLCPYTHTSCPPTGKGSSMIVSGTSHWLI